MTRRLGCAGSVGHYEGLAGKAEETRSQLTGIELTQKLEGIAQIEMMLVRRTSHVTSAGHPMIVFDSARS